VRKGATDSLNWRRRTSKPAVIKAGLPDLMFHDLRALAGTTLIAAGADIKTVQTRLDHANPQTTLRLYARAQPEADRLAGDAAGSMLQRSMLRPAPNVRPHRNSSWVKNHL
jgi:integrase